MQVAALLEERVNQGVNFLLSGEIDQYKKVITFASSRCTPYLSWAQTLKVVVPQTQVR